jgi:stage III sporulation protein AG
VGDEHGIFGFGEWIGKVHGRSGTFWILIGAAAVGVVLLTFGNVPQETRSPAGASQAAIGVSAALTDEERLEAELTRTLTRIAGAGQVRVDLNLRSENRSVWERETRVNKRVNQEQNSVNTEEDTNDQMVLAKDRDGRDSPVLREKLAPEIQGVIVVATGASDLRVRRLLTATVMTSLDLPAHRVMVIAGETSKEVTGNE